MARQSKKDHPKKRCIMRVELVFSDDGKVLAGWVFKAGNSQRARRVLDQLISGEIAGLEYCKERTVRPFAGGAGSYFIGFPKEITTRTS